MLRAASTNSLFFNEIICPRTTRATTSQLTKANAIKRLNMFRPKIAIMMITNSMYGKPYIISTIRMMM